jgi:hypothetical protein
MTSGSSAAVSGVTTSPCAAAAATSAGSASIVDTRPVAAAAESAVDPVAVAAVDMPAGRPDSSDGDAS